MRSPARPKVAFDAARGAGGVQEGDARYTGPSVNGLMNTKLKRHQRRLNGVYAEISYLYFEQFRLSLPTRKKGW